MFESQLSKRVDFVHFAVICPLLSPFTIFCLGLGLFGFQFSLSFVTCSFSIGFLPVILCIPFRHGEGFDSYRVSLWHLTSCFFIVFVSDCLTTMEHRLASSQISPCFFIR
jgi:hypothetical protein